MYVGQLLPTSSGELLYFNYHHMYYSESDSDSIYMSSSLEELSKYSSDSLADPSASCAALALALTSPKAVHRVDGGLPSVYRPMT
jgi:hypothetical protein